MRLRMVKVLLLAAVSGGTLFQLGSCLADTAGQVVRVAILDIFVGPLLGNTCTIIDQTTCD